MEPEPESSTVVAIYKNHMEAEAAVKALQHAGGDMRRLSIIGKDFYQDEHIVGYYSTGERMQAWGKLGAFWGGMWGFLLGAAFFIVPGIGHLLIAGPLVHGIVGALEGAAVSGGVSALGAGLVSLGVPKDSVVRYETQIKAGKFVLVFHGTQTEALTAKVVLELTDHEGITQNSL